MPTTNNFINYEKILNTFYRNCTINNNDISKEKIDQIIEKSKDINMLYNYEHYKPTKLRRYIKIMETIHSNYREGIPTKSKFSSTSITEKLLLFMFSVDPDFEAFIIHSSEDTIREIQNKIEYKFGIYDKNLVKIERFFIKYFMSQKKQQDIFEEVDKRAFK